jgi:Pyridoxamine 5'-phosphate oxidase
MSGLPPELLDLIASGPMAHLSTINPDGSPQVTVIWIGLDGDELVSGHLGWRLKLRQHPAGPAGRVVLRCPGGASTSPQLASSNTSTPRVCSCSSSYPIGSEMLLTRLHRLES